MFQIEGLFQLRLIYCSEKLACLRFFFPFGTSDMLQVLLQCIISHAEFSLYNYPWTLYNHEISGICLIILSLEEQQMVFAIGLPQRTLFFFFLSEAWVYI